MAIRFRGRDGVGLAADVYGPWDGPPVLLLHGGGQTRHAWGGTSGALGDAGFLAFTLDLRGHGESDWAPDADYGLGAYADDIRCVLERIGGPAALVGASLGGIASLIAAGEEPRTACTALVLVDVTPRIDRDGRDRIGEFMRAHPEGFATVEEAADSVSRFLPHRPRPADISGLRKNLRLEADGRYHWHWDPAFLEGRLSEDATDAERLERAAAAIPGPILLVRGRMSEVVSEESLAAFRRNVPDSEFVDVPGAAHMVAGDRNDAFTAAVVEFLSRRLLRRSRAD